MTSLEFGLLGPLLVTCGGESLPVPAGRSRVVLALLLLNAGRVVSAAELTDALWESGPPASARASLQNYVRRLRAALGDHDHSLIRTAPGGYLIRAEAGQVDVSRFEAGLRAVQAAARAGAWARSADAARSALSLWRGEPLADVPSPVLAGRELPRLAELRFRALQAGIEADLHLGRHADVLPGLRGLVAAAPLREEPQALLMLALYRCGRQADALAVYRTARRVLAEELGTEPGAGLRELHQRVLSADPSLTAGGAVAPAGGPPPPVRVVPMSLPGAVRPFAGRAAELSTLTGLLDRADAEVPGTVVISAIGGTAGVGKTALAVHWAHQAAGRFPDGQLYVDLRGYDPAQPVAAPAALSGFLRELGVPGGEIPADAAERATRYRSLLAGRRMLVVLDNAGSEEQVRPLLPATAGCMTVVTSRDTLPGLVAREGARRIELGPLPLADAAGLLRMLIGAQAAADPVATEALAQQCSRLPLALRVAAERAASRPGTSLAGLVAELADQQRRLDLLDAGGDPRAAMRAVFSWSYRQLRSQARRAFRLVGLHPGPDFDAYAMAALVGLPLPEAGAALRELVRAHLVRPAGADRYRMHDLLRAYASELAASHEAEPERAAAMTRLLDYCQQSVAAAMDALYPAERHRRPGPAGPAGPVPPMTGPEAARAWLGAERSGLVAVTAHAAAHGWPGHATRLAASLFRYLDNGGFHAESMTVQDCARDAASRSGDISAEAQALTSLGVVQARQGRYRQAADYLHRSVSLYRGTGDPGGRARALSNLGFVEFRCGRQDQAAGHLRQSLALHQTAGDQVGEARARSSLGIIDLEQGRYGPAARQFRNALALYRGCGERTGEAHALANLGETELRRERYVQAASYLRRALVLHEGAGNPDGAAVALSGLGTIDVRQGRSSRAVGHYQRALAASRETGNRLGEAVALNGLGEALLAAGQPAAAAPSLAAALTLASEAGAEYEQARAHDCLGQVHQALDELGRARGQWRLALALFQRLGAPEAARVRVRLDAVGEPAGPGPWTGPCRSVRAPHRPAQTASAESASLDDQARTGPARPRPRA